MSDDLDVVVVGAGLSGLSAARTLQRQGRSVAVVEARDRVGGKMYTVELGGCAVDLGAHWVGPTQRRMLALAEELGLEVEKQHVDGRHVLVLAGERREFTGLIPFTTLPGLAETVLAVGRAELRRPLIDRAAPWRSRGAAQLDGFTLAHWMRGLRSESAKATFTITARTVFGAEPEELSFLYFLWYSRCAGGLMQLTGFEGAAQDAHLRGGTQQVCERLAAELGDAVSLGTPVKAIEHAPGGVKVAVGRRKLRARKAIVAVSPSIAGRIEFEPALPAQREALAQRMPMGAYMKGVAVYERAWWRDRGLSGLSFGDRGLVQMTVDASPPGGEPGVLVGFVTGAPARGLAGLDPAARRGPLLDAMAALVGPEAAEPESYRDLNWHEERWSRGAPLGLMGPGTLTTLGPALTEPAGPVHWAGTETATEWKGFMEGAVEAGERAAAEV